VPAGYPVGYAERASRPRRVAGAVPHLPALKKPVGAMSETGRRLGRTRMTVHPVTLPGQSVSLSQLMSKRASYFFASRSSQT
jgi:hypothetical protein